MSSVEIEELRVAYGVTLVIDGLSLSIDPAASGRIRFGERDITSLPAHHRDIGMVFQDYALFPDKTVFENLAYACAPGALRKRPSRADIDVSKIVSPPKLSDIKVLPIDEEEAAAKRTEFLAQWASAVAEAR